MTFVTYKNALNSDVAKSAENQKTAAAIFGGLSYFFHIN